MKKYYVSEIFYSLQGEGKRIGTPSIFIRLFGCNLKCEGFGMPKGELSNERNLIDTTDITDLTQLPIVKTGCDSYASWDKRFRHLSKLMSIDDITDAVFDLIPDGKTLEDIDVIFTGGEPMMYQSSLIDIINKLYQYIGDLKNITIETNGTYKISKEMIGFSRYYDIQFSVSQKLSRSGEPINKRLNYDSLASYFSCTSFSSQFKFVVASEDDLLEINEILKYLHDVRFLRNLDVYLMPVGGTLNDYRDNMHMVSKMALDNGFKYSPRLHLDLYGNSWNT